MKRLTSLFTGVSAAALFAMMLLTAADVFARKFLPNSITGAVELTELLMMVMIFFALPLASIAGEHIVFDLLDRVVPAAMLRWQHRLSHALTALVFNLAPSPVAGQLVALPGPGRFWSRTRTRPASQENGEHRPWTDSWSD